MRRTITLTLALGLVAALGLSSPVSAEPPAPQVTDAAGDANFVNAQGQTANAPANGVDSRAAFSADGADLRSIRLHTRYWTVRMYGEDGSLEKIDHRPMALQVDITTTGPIKPTFGPSLIYIVPTVINGCEAWFQVLIRGPFAQTFASGDPERMELRKINVSGQPACPGGAVTMTNPAFQLAIDGNQISLMYPFEAFTGAMSGFIKEGTVVGTPPSFLNASRYSSVRTVHYAPTLPPPGGNNGLIGVAVVDEAARFPTFTVGSDVPADVICADTPDHPECAA